MIICLFFDFRNRLFNLGCFLHANPFSRFSFLESRLIHLASNPPSSSFLLLIFSRAPGGGPLSHPHCHSINLTLSPDNCDRVRRGGFAGIFCCRNYLSVSVWPTRSLAFCGRSPGNRRRSSRLPCARVYLYPRHCRVNLQHIYFL